MANSLGSPRAFRWRPWTALGLALLIGAAAVPPVARRLARHGVAVELDDVVGLEGGSGRSLLGRAGAAAKAAGVGAVGGAVQFRVRARNITPVPVWVRSARFRARAQGRLLGYGTWTALPGPRLFWPGEDVPLVVSLDGEGAAVRTAGLRFVQGQDVGASAEGEVDAGVPPLFLSLPFEVERVGMRARR